jgi:hypothetical protein
VGGSSKQPSTTTQITQAAPPAYLEPYYRNAAEQATQLYNQGGGFFQGSMVAPMSATTQNALRLTEQRAMSGNPLDAAAQNTALATARGNFLGSNPFLDSAADAANRSTVRQFRDATLPGLQGNFARAGRYGSNAQNNAVQGAQEALATGIADSNAKLYGTEYANERQRMLAAAQMAPSLTQTDFRNLSVLEGVGGTYDDFAQANLNDQARQAELARARLDEHVARINGIGGNYQNATATGITPAPRTSRAAGALGGAASGAGIGMMVGGPWGAAAGAGLGALGGLFM